MPIKLKKPRVLRDDLRGVLRAPKEIQEFLLRAAGYTPHKEAMYRLVWAENVYEVQGGRWDEWAENLSVNERCYPNTPIRTVVGLQEVVKYVGMVGWILERWKPTPCSEYQWLAAKVPETHIPMLGPYPENGIYEHAAGPTVTMPTTEELKAAIEETEWNFAQHDGNVERAVRERVARAVEAYKEEGRQLRERTEQMVRDVLSPWRSTSLQAGRWRNEMALRAGITEHAGN